MSMRTVSRWTLLLAAAAILSACAGSQERGPLDRPVSVESLLTVEEFRAAGLDKLKEEELTALNAGLTRALGTGEGDGVVDEAALAAWEASEDYPLATFGLNDEHPAARARDEMRAQLAESISRWSADTRIHLKNGQVWEVTSSPGTGVPSVEAGESLTIRRGALGSFRLSLEGSNRTIRVRRRE